MNCFGNDQFYIETSLPFYSRATLLRRLFRQKITDAKFEKIMKAIFQNALFRPGDLHEAETGFHNKCVHLTKPFARKCTFLPDAPASGFGFVRQKSALSIDLLSLYHKKYLLII